MTIEGEGGRVQAAIRQKLSEALTPSRLDIVDDSARHAGHVGARPEGESHFIVEIASGASQVFPGSLASAWSTGCSKDELRTDVHALALKTVTPDEDAAG